MKNKLYILIEKIINFVKKEIFINNICFICKKNIENEFLCEYCNNFEKNRIPCKICLREVENYFDICNQCNDNGVISYFDDKFCIFKQNEFSKKIIYQYKYNHKRYYSELFANFIIKKIDEIKLNIKIDLIIPIPSGKERIAYRGYDHIGDIVEIVEKKQKIPYFKLLKRVKHKKAQVSLNKKERINNIKNSYEIDKTELSNIKRYFNTDIFNLNVLIIDDIYTTGATIDEARKEIMGLFNKYYCMVIFKS